MVFNPLLTPVAYTTNRSVELLMGKPPSLKNPDDYGLTYLVRPLSALLQSHELSKRVPKISKDVDAFTKDLLAQPLSTSK